MIQNGVWLPSKKNSGPYIFWVGNFSKSYVVSPECFPDLRDGFSIPKSLQSRQIPERSRRFSRRYSRQFEKTGVPLRYQNPFFFPPGLLTSPGLLSHLKCPTWTKASCWRPCQWFYLFRITVLSTAGKHLPLLFLHYLLLFYCRVPGSNGFTLVHYGAVAQPTDMPCKAVRPSFKTAAELD